MFYCEFCVRSLTVRFSSSGREKRSVFCVRHSFNFRCLCNKTSNNSIFLPCHQTVYMWWQAADASGQIAGAFGMLSRESPQLLQYLSCCDHCGHRKLQSVSKKVSVNMWRKTRVTVLCMERCKITKTEKKVIFRIVFKFKIRRKNFHWFLKKALVKK